MSPKAEKTASLVWIGCCVAAAITLVAIPSLCAQPEPQAGSQVLPEDRSPTGISHGPDPNWLVAGALAGASVAVLLLLVCLAVLAARRRRRRRRQERRNGAAGGNKER